MFPRCPRCGSRNLEYPLSQAPRSEEAYIRCLDCGYRWYADVFDGSKRHDSVLFRLSGAYDLLRNRKA